MIVRYEDTSKGSMKHDYAAEKKFKESITDKSNYRPEASIRRAELGSVHAIQQGLYDYNNNEEAAKGDKDFMANLRRKDLDIVDVMQTKDALEKYVEKNKAETNEKVKKAIEDAKKVSESTKNEVGE